MTYSAGLAFPGPGPRGSGPPGSEATLREALLPWMTSLEREGRQVTVLEATRVGTGDRNPNVGVTSPIKTSGQGTLRHRLSSVPHGLPQRSVCSAPHTTIDLALVQC